jgi:[NiFe] hydrogenase assembly HybE family chaperone
MTTDRLIAGYATNPKALVEQTYQAIMDNDMIDMPFCDKNVPIYAAPFVVYEDQWLGVLLTPWTLSILLFPGFEQHWPQRKIGDKLAIEINAQHYTFMVNEQPQLGQYLACSLMSPVVGISNADGGKTLVKDLMNKLNEIPLHVQEDVDLDKRHLFRRNSSNVGVDKAMTA